MAHEELGQRPKLLIMKEIFETETDRNHPMTMSAMSVRLNERGITTTAHNGTKKRDRDVLASAGVDIREIPHTRPTQYYAQPRFKDEEMMLMVDSALGTRFLSDAGSRSLVAKLLALASPTQRDAMGNRVPRKGDLLVEGRGAHEDNRLSFENVGIINRALGEGRKISFRYCARDTSGKLVARRKDRYVRTPLKLVYQSGLYYLLTLREESDEDFGSFRVDRMQAISIEEDAAARPQRAVVSKMNHLQDYAFSMYTGSENAVVMQLAIRQDMINVVVDRFPDAILTPIGEGWARFSQRVYLTPTLYAWLATFGDKLRILGPERLRDDYRLYLSSASSASLDDAPWDAS